MLRYIHSIALIGLALIAVFSSSCGSDPHDPDPVLSGNVEKYFPSYCVNLNTSYGFSNKNFHMTAEPYFYFDPEKWGIVIEKVAYYIDDSHIKTMTESPFAIEYESSDWSVGAHRVRADITISGDNIETFVLQANKVIDNSSSQTKAADIWFDFNYATTGEEFVVSGNINLKRSAAGTKVKSFSGTWDGTSMGEKTSTPFVLTHKVTDDAGTKHSVDVTLKYMQGATEYRSSFAIPTYEIPGPKSMMLTFRLKSRYADYRNGEMLEGIARQFIGEEVKAIYGFELYLDEKLIGESMMFPYELSYKLENLELGEHILKKQWVRYDEDGNKTSSFSTDEEIIITQ